jgi:hypothetical protein
MESVANAMCYPYYYVWAIAIPVVVAILLFVMKPVSVMKTVDGKMIYDGNQFMNVTVMYTIVGWILLAVINYMMPEKVQYCVSRRILM